MPSERYEGQSTCGRKRNEARLNYQSGAVYLIEALVPNDFAVPTSDVFRNSAGLHT